MDTLPKTYCAGRAAYLDVLRFVSCLLVVAVHITSNGWQDFPVRSGNWQVLCAYNSLGVLGVAFFFMISGALFLRPVHTASYGKLLRKILHLGVLYYLWNLLYDLQTLWQEGGPWDGPRLHRLIHLVLEGKGGYHLWFLPTLVGLYLLVPLLRLVFAHKQACEYFLLCYGVVGLLFPQWIQLQLPGDQYLSTLCEEFLWPFQSMSYLGYFVLGHYLDIWPVEPRCFRARPAAGIGLVALGAFALSFGIRGGFSLYTDTPAYFENPLTLPDFVACAALFLLVQRLCRRCTPACQGRARALAALSLGIYLIHPALVNLLQQVLHRTLAGIPLVTVPLQVLSVAAVSGGITALLRRIPFIRHFRLL